MKRGRRGDIVLVMDIGIPAERKNHEYRVALDAKAAGVAVRRGHTVLVERGAGRGCGIADEEYSAAGAELVDTEEELFSRSELVVKVKEPQEGEYGLLRDGLLLFSYLHIAPDPALQKVLAESGVTAVAFETVELEDGSLPLLAPMSRLAGQLAVQAGIHYLETPVGGKGVLLGGAPGVNPGRVVVVGGGTVGYNAALVAHALRADVVVLDINQPRLDYLHREFGGRVRTLYSYPQALATEIARADLVVGAVLVTGAAAPRVITSAMVESMERGSVLADVAIDQGGCAETSRPTSHSEPVYTEHGVTHYCVTNIPSLVARSATHALSNAILPYVLVMAGGGLKDDPALKRGINAEGGAIVLEAAKGT